MKHLLAAARQCALRIPAEAAVCCAAAFLLTAVSTGGQYAPWALAAVAENRQSAAGYPLPGGQFPDG